MTVVLASNRRNFIKFIYDHIVMLHVKFPSSQTKGTESTSFLIPLSHQGGVLTVIPWCPKNCRTPRWVQYGRRHHPNNAVALPLDTVGSHRTPSDGAHFELTQNKHHHSVCARRPNKAQRVRCKVTIATQ